MSALVLNLNALLLILNLGWGLAAASMPIIPAPWGKISGTNVTSPGGQVYYSYLAIPYALPPVKERRFARPVPHPGPAVGVVFEATSPGSVCPQLTPTMEMLVNEDCLTLDVHVPVGANGNGSNSVMVFIHGGNFVIGASPFYTPSELVTENDVIVVVIQYRLGILGFLSSGDNAASGNYGLLDQNLAIRWVRGNIRAFGGDEGSITLYGQAAGAASVGYHLLSPYSWGLFSRVILQSGTPLGSWALNKNPRETFNLVAKISGCEVAASTIGFAYYYRRVARRQQAEHERIVACLREMDFHQLLKFTSLPAHSLRSSDILPWAPVVDGDFIPRDPTDLLRDVNYLVSNDVISRDVMMGLNNQERAYLLPLTEGFKADLLTIDPSADLTQLDNLLNLDIDFLRGLLREELKYRYPGEFKADDKRLDVITEVLEFSYIRPFLANETKVVTEDISETFGDIFFTIPAVKFLRDLMSSTQLAKGGVGRRYMYLYNHFPNRAEGQEMSGISHIEDIPYVFDANNFFPRDNFSAEEFAMGTTFRSFLSNFAKTGRPEISLNETDTGKEGTWPEFTSEKEEYLSLEPLPRVEEHLYAKRVGLWLDLVPTLVNSTRLVAAQGCASERSLSWKLKGH